MCVCVFTTVHNPHSPVLLLRTTLEPLWGTMCFWLAMRRLQGGWAAAAVCWPTDASDVARNWTSISANPPSGASCFPPRWQNRHTHLQVTVRPHPFLFKRVNSSLCQEDRNSCQSWTTLVFFRGFCAITIENIHHQNFKIHAAEFILLNSFCWIHSAQQSQYR